MPEDVLKDIMEKVQELKPMPEVVHRAIELLREDYTSPKEVEELIGSDPAATANLLKLANSPYYYLRSRVNSLKRAIVVLGTREVLNILIAMYASRYIKRDAKGYFVDAEGMWRHALLVAFLSKYLSKVLGIESDLSYTAGLLHDIGKVVLGEYLDMKIREGELKPEDIGGSDVPFSELERKFLGIDHAELGGRIMELWGFPEELVFAARFHHRPSDARSHRKLVFLVHLANAFVLSLGVGVGLDGLMHELDPFALEILGISITPDFADRVFSELTMELRRIEEGFSGREA